MDIVDSARILFTLPEDEFFEGIVDIGADAAGNIYLCDFQACNIKKFSAEGKFQKIIGRKGQGPGEFNMPWWIAVTGDRLFIYDMGNRRLCSLTTDGEYIKSIGIQNTEGRPRNMRAHPGGDVLQHHAAIRSGCVLGCGSRR